MYLNFKQADSELFFISLYKFHRIINNKKTIYSNVIYIIIIKEDLSRLLISYTRFMDIFLKLVLDQLLLY
jgi:hypothetical protein